MTGIIGAMDVEVESLKELTASAEKNVFAGIEFVSGKIEGTDVCIARCNPGKVNAALCAQLMIDRYQPDEIINIGVGCSLCGGVEIKNIVVATEVCQYDFDTSAIDGVKGLVIDGKIKIEADRSVSERLAKAAEAAGARVHRGCIASGDTFIASQALKNGIAAEFGAVCGEMEGGAIGQVCYINGVPFAVLRSVSDGGNEAAVIDYPTFKSTAAKTSTEAMLNYLKNK